MLNGMELAKLDMLLESMDARKRIVYGQVLISGTLYSSAIYNRSDITNDSIISLSSSNGSTLVGTVQEVCQLLPAQCNSSTCKVYFESKVSYTVRVSTSLLHCHRCLSHKCYRTT